MYKVEVANITPPLSPDIVVLSGVFFLILILLIAIAYNSYKKTGKK